MTEIAINNTTRRVFNKIVAWRDHAKTPLVRDGELCICVTHDQLAVSLTTTPSTVQRHLRVLRLLDVIRVKRGAHPFIRNVLSASFIFVDDERAAEVGLAKLAKYSLQSAGTIPSKMQDSSYSNTKNTPNGAKPMGGAEEVGSSGEGKEGEVEVMVMGCRRGKGSAKLSQMETGNVQDILHTSASFEEPTMPEFEKMDHKVFEKIWKFLVANETGVTQSPFSPAEKAMAKAAVMKLAEFSKERKIEIMTYAVTQWLGILLRLKRIKRDKGFGREPRVQQFLGKFQNIVTYTFAEEVMRSKEDPNFGVSIEDAYK